MKAAPAVRILAIAALCVGALIALVISEGAARDAGEEALVPMEAVDPRALLQGHYVQLNLLQRLEPGAPCPVAANGAGWVTFNRGADNVLRFVGAAPSRDAAQQMAPVLIKGSFICSEPIVGAGDDPGMPGWVRLDIGVERFYVDQDEALRIERILRAQQPGAETRAYAVISVGRDGRARLKGLMIDGERFELRWL